MKIFSLMLSYQNICARIVNCTNKTNKANSLLPINCYWCMVTYKSVLLNCNVPCDQETQTLSRRTSLLI